ncbi:MAG: cytochrome c3 family protein [Candidatus Zixiibacteriota bacterium]
MNCLQCHTCEVPTAKDKCLKACPSLSMTHVTAAHQLSEAPDSMLLDELASEYQPVHFNHKLHAKMAQMGQNCVTCHHYSPSGRVPPCKECHANEGGAVNLRQPSLKGAYHRQCLSCHREWSHDTKCVICHKPNGKTKTSDTVADSTDIMGSAHPIITEPVKKVYQTPYQQGPVVTFQHKEHIDLFGLRCVDCHKKENCSYCHDIDKPAKLAKTQEEVHAVCNDCHGKAVCDKCHDNRERPGFNHESTGWALGTYHEDLVCRACHPTGKRIVKMNNQCSNCHSGWNPANFKHAVTGLRLDEIHAEVDCTDCHAQRKFDAPPTCSGCHDDNRHFKDQPPGEYVKRM